MSSRRTIIALIITAVLEAVETWSTGLVRQTWRTKVLAREVLAQRRWRSAHDGIPPHRKMFYHCSTNKSWEDIMSTTGATENRHLIPALGRLYPKVSECAYVLLRVAAGLMLVPHVWPKLMAGPAAVASNVMVRRGVEPALLAAYLAIILEVVGAICITLGLFTRAVAALLVIEFLVIVKVHSVSGWM